jgi:hypothetical protein
MNSELQKLDLERLKLNVYPPSIFNRPEQYYKTAIKLETFDALEKYYENLYEQEKKTELFQGLYSRIQRWFNEYLAEYNYFGMSGEECVKLYTDKYFEFFYLDQIKYMTGFVCEGFDQKLKIVDKIGLENLQKKTSVVFALAHNGPHYFVPLYLAYLGYDVSFSGGFGPHIESGFKNVVSTYKCKGSTGAVNFDDHYFENCKKVIKNGGNMMIYPEYSRSTRVGTLVTDFYDKPLHIPTGAIRLGEMFNLPVVLVYLRKVELGYELVFDKVFKPTKFKFLLGKKNTYKRIQMKSLDLFNIIKEVVYEKPEYWECWRYFGIIQENTRKALENKKKT